jgi:hypothetical protein
LRKVIDHSNACIFCRYHRDRVRCGQHDFLYLKVVVSKSLIFLY